MLVRKPQVKFFLSSGGPVSLEGVVPVFHRFIRDHALGNELLVDVADYAHVQDGPGVVLVGDGSDYYVDLSSGRPGLLYSRKRRGPEDALDCVVDAFRRALAACRLLEQESSLEPPFRFLTNELLFKINDRLEAENSETSFSELAPTLDRALARLYGAGAFSMRREGTPKELLTVRVNAPGAPGVAELLDRLGGAPG